MDILELKEVLYKTCFNFHMYYFMKGGISNGLFYNEKYLKSEIDMTRDALNAAYSNFDNATDPDLIDCYIYQLNSEQKRYKYLLQLAREYEDNTTA